MYSTSDLLDYIAKKTGEGNARVSRHVYNNNCREHEIAEWYEVVLTGDIPDYGQPVRVFSEKTLDDMTARVIRHLALERKFGKYLHESESNYQ